MVTAVENLFPGIFCLEDIQCLPCDTGGVRYRATLYHDSACVTVMFDCKQCEPHCKKGAFVSVRWLPDTQSIHGAIQVDGLTALNASADGYFNVKNFNPFLTVPRTWEIDRNLVNFTRELWGISSKAKRKLLFDNVFLQSGDHKQQL